MIRKISIILFILLAILLGAMIALINTSAGTKHTLQLAQKFIPGLSIRGIHGHLFGKLTLNQLHYQTSGFSVHIQQIQLDWNGWKLLSGKVAIKKLHAKTIVLTLTTAPQTPQSLPLKLKLPFAIQIQQADLQNVRIHKDNRPFLRLARLHFAAEISMNNHLNVEAQWQKLQLYTLQPAHDKQPQAISGKIALNIRHKQVNLVYLQVHAGNAWLKAQGKLDQRWDLHWQIKLPDLHAFGKSFSGSIYSRGKIQGPRLSPLFQASTQLHNFAMATAHIAKLNAKINLALTTIQLGAKIKLQGTLDIPQAWLKTEEMHTASIELPSDVVFVKPKTSSPKKTVLQKNPLDITALIKVKLGNKVYIDAYNAKGRLSGALTIQYHPSRPTTATGELRINKGIYSAYGQKLKISSSKILFIGGPVNDPSLDIQAIRKVKVTARTAPALIPGASLPAEFSQLKTITVGVRIQGTAQAPKAILFSAPPGYSQADILSLLLFGTTTKNISAASGQILLNAASSLNLGGIQVSGIQQELQNTLGLDTLGIESESAFDAKNNTLVKTPAVVIGKQFLRDFYVSYSIGILKPINILRIRYDFSERFSIQSETSSLGSGVDLFYHFTF